MKALSRRSKTLLLSSLLITLTACQAAMPVMPVMPTKPVLDVQVQTDGGMCLNAQSTERLAIYIIELERGYK